MKKNILLSKLSIGWVRILLILIPYYITTSIFVVLGYAIITGGVSSIHLTQTLEDTIVMFCACIGSLITIWTFVKFIDKESFIAIGFQIKNRIPDIVAGIGIGAIVMTLAITLMYLTNEISIVRISINYLEVITSVILFLIVAINEEVFVRGYILKNLITSVNKYLALCISAVLFATMHYFNNGLNILSFFDLFLGGILLGSSYIYTRNLWFPISLHFSWNLFQSLLGFNVSGRDSYSIVEFSFDEPNIYNGGIFGFEGSIFSIIIQLILIIGIFYYYRRKEHNLNTV